MSERPPGITRKEALRRLCEMADSDDPEIAHVDADEVLLGLIDDDEITAAFGAIPKWYA